VGYDGFDARSRDLHLAQPNVKPFLLFLVGAALAATAFFAAVASQTRRPIPPDSEPVHTTESGLVWSALAPGAAAGKRPAMGDEVTVHYTGWLLDGTIFDSSVDRGEPATFRLGEVIDGWNEGLQLMTVGARHKLTIPFDLAYGEAGRPPTIPQKATLIFEVELLDVIPAPVPPEFVRPDPEKSQKLDSGVIFQVLEEGAGDPPAADQVFVLDYAFWSPDGVLVEFSGTANGPIKSSAQMMNLPFLKELPLRMAPGSVVVAEVPPAAGLAASQRTGRWTTEPTIWRIEMLEIVKPLELPAFQGGPKPVRVEELDGGLVLEILKEGDGPTPTARQQVEVHYAGWLTDGTLFDSSYDRGEPSSFGVGQVIPGWTRGLMKMKVGTVARLRIPAELGYGRRGSPPKIPPGADLVFHVELLSIRR